MIAHWRNWYQASIANRWTVALWSLAFLLITAVTLSTIFLAHRSFVSLSDRALVRELNLGRDHLTLRLNRLNRHMEILSQQEWLAGNQSVNQQVTILLTERLGRDDLVEDDGYTLMLHDGGGKILALAGPLKNLYGQDVLNSMLEKQAARVIQTGLASSKVLHVNDQSFLGISYPILEGFSSQRISLSVILSGQVLMNDLAVLDTQSVGWSLITHTGPWLGLVPDSQKIYWESSQTLPVAPSMQGLGLRLYLFETRDLAWEPMQEFLLSVLTTITLLLLAFWILIRYWIHHLMDPIKQLTNWVQEKQYQVSSTEPKALSGKDELGRLYQQFQILLFRLNEFQQNLEEQIKNRTDQLLVAQRDVQRNAEKLEALLELSPDGLVEIRADDSVGYVNAAAKRLLPLLPKDITGQSLEFFLESLQGHAVDLLPHNYWSHLERLAREDRLWEWQRDYPHPLVLLCGLVQGSQGERLWYVRDVNAAVQLGRMKSEFLATAAHELRTPLANIQGYAQLAQRSPQSEQLFKYWQLVERKSQDLAVFLEDLLSLARADVAWARHQNLQIQGVTQWLRHVGGTFVLPDDERRPRLELVDHLPEVRMDRAQMTQVLINLLTNAYKYSDWSAAVTIRTVFTEEDPHWVGFAVEDTGMGMTQEEQNHLFQRFYRAHPGGDIPGSGLGLALVAQIVAAHDGRIEVKSELGVGSCFTVLLPVVRNMRSSVVPDPKGEDGRPKSS